MDLSCKVGVSKILVQDFPMLQVWEFIPQGQEYWNSHPSLPGLVLTPSALTFAFTFTDDFLCYLVASAYVGIIRLRNHQLADRNMRSVRKKTHPVNGKNKEFQVQGLWAEKPIQ